MEENITHALSMVGSVILFIFALSYAIFSYESLERRAEFFFEVHSITARQGDATTQLVDKSKVQRKVGFEEILLGVIEMPRYVSTSGNNSNSKIKIKSSVGEAIFSVVTETDPTTSNTKYLVCLNPGTKYYDIGNEDDLIDLTEEVIFYTLGKSVSISSSNMTLASVKDEAKSTTFSISYDEESIVYTQNT